MANKPSADVKKFMPSHFLDVLGKNLPAIIKAVNEGHLKTEQLIQACIDQLFLSTASGRYLVQLGEQEGFTMPPNSGLDIRAYRTLVPIMVSSPKQVRISMDDIVQAFYKNERTKPYVQSSVVGPYSLNSGDDLILETESGLLTITILDNQVSDLSNASAQEIAAIINSTQTSVLAEALIDRSTGNGSVRILSNTKGAGAFIRVAGGTLQNVLKFENLVTTLNATGTTWNITKTSTLSDEVTFTWDGVGTNPEVFLANKGDVITIRGLTDVGADFYLLNGSYEALEVGYDYFTIRNGSFLSLAETLIQTDDNNIVFTKADKLTIFDRGEFATTSETDNQTITITVPAVPPLALRFLGGSAHLHGAELDVLDFTRTSLQVLLPSGTEKPQGDNQLLFASNVSRYNFRQKRYKTFGVDSSTTTPTYQVESNDDTFYPLPYTVPSPLLDTDAIYAEIDSDEYVVTFQFRHGLKKTWGMTLTGATGSANVLAGDLNKEHSISRAINEYQVAIKPKDSSGQPIIFQGLPWGTGDVYRHSADQADGSDFYIEFASGAAALASGLQIGTLFKFNPADGVNVDTFFASLLKFRKLTVTSISGNIVNFSSGLGTGLTGLIISGAQGNRSSGIGGSAMREYLDKASDLNISRVFNNLRCVFINYTPSSNPLYVGSYLYDPDGDQTSVTISKYVVSLTDNVLRGENTPSLLVDSLVAADGSEMPQSGNLVIDYGRGNTEGPIRYYAVVENSGSNQIFIDPAYKFKFSHPVGAKVQYIHENTAYSPTQDGSDYPVYLTGTTASRDTMFELIKLLVAAGIFVEEDVIKPDLRYDDTAIVPFD